MFRLGLLLSGGARGPGVFFIVPCVDIVEIIDMRVQTFNVPPQEVRTDFSFKEIKRDVIVKDSHKRQCHSLRQCNHVVQSEGCDKCCG